MARDKPPNKQPMDRDIYDEDDDGVTDEEDLDSQNSKQWLDIIKGNDRKGVPTRMNQVLQKRQVISRRGQIQSPGWKSWW